MTRYLLLMPPAVAKTHASQPNPTLAEGTRVQVKVPASAEIIEREIRSVA